MADDARLASLRLRAEGDPASTAFAELAELYRRAGRLDEAVEWCRRGLAVHQGHRSARVTLARSFLELGRLDEAEQEVAIVLREVPDHFFGLRTQAEIYRRRRMAAAVDTGVSEISFPTMRLLSWVAVGSGQAAVRAEAALWELEAWLTAILADRQHTADRQHS